MRVLVAESDAALAEIWCNHIRREGSDAVAVPDEKAAIDALRFHAFDVLVIDLMLPNASVLAISDYATYRNPNVAIIVVTANSFFSDGSIFDLIPNARSYLNTPVNAEDLAALAGHYGAAAKQA
ncbi:MAG: response regulator [Pseudomonadota bacterium]